MRRPLILLLLAIPIAVAVAAASAAATAPIVSPKADPYYRYGGLRGTKGFGQTRPRTIYYGGDETGLVCRIHWYRWGGRVARGRGVSWYVSRNESTGHGHAAKVNVVASNLGKWKGRPAYTKLKWYFPKHGRERTSACS